MYRIKRNKVKLWEKQVFKDPNKSIASGILQFRIVCYQALAYCSISGIGSGRAGGGYSPPRLESGGALPPRREVYNDNILYTVVLYVRVHSILVNCLHVLNLLKLVNRM